MKCPKCGSENIFYNTSYDGKDYYICGNCKTHYSLPTVAVSKTEPTTAEMLLWLFYNTNFRIRNDGELGYYQNECFTKFEYEFQNKSKDEAVKRAYDWAKQEERK